MTKDPELRRAVGRQPASRCVMRVRLALGALTPARGGGPSRVSLCASFGSHAAKESPLPPRARRLGLRRDRGSHGGSTRARPTAVRATAAAMWRQHASRDREGEDPLRRERSRNPRAKHDRRFIRRPDARGTISRCTVLTVDGTLECCVVYKSVCEYYGLIYCLYCTALTVQLSGNMLATCDSCLHVSVRVLRLQLVSAT